MTLPAKGTTARMIVDYVKTAKYRTAGSICKTINIVNKGTVMSLIESQKDAGNLRQDAAGISLTEKSRKAYRAEVEQKEVAHYTMPPISAKNIPSALGMREGSNDHLSWSSRHV